MPWPATGTVPVSPAPGNLEGPLNLGAPPSLPLRARYLPWAELLRRVREVEVLRCSRCPGRRRVIAFITDSDVVTAILAHLGLPTQPPQLAAARAAPAGGAPVRPRTGRRRCRSASRRFCLTALRSSLARRKGTHLPATRPSPTILRGAARFPSPAALLARAHDTYPRLDPYVIAQFELPIASEDRYLRQGQVPVPLDRLSQPS